MITGNEPARPITEEGYDHTELPSVKIEPGETLLQKWSAMMLQGIVSSCNHTWPHEMYAKQAVTYAKALIAELNKEV